MYGIIALSNSEDAALAAAFWLLILAVLVVGVWLGVRRWRRTANDSGKRILTFVKGPLRLGCRLHRRRSDQRLESTSDDFVRAPVSEERLYRDHKTGEPECGEHHRFFNFNRDRVDYLLGGACHLPSCNPAL